MPSLKSKNPGASCAKDRKQQSGNKTKADRERITPDLPAPPAFPSRNCSENVGSYGEFILHDMTTSWRTWNLHFSTMWGPRSIAKLLQKPPITMVYGTYNELVTGANLNQRSHHNGGGPHCTFNMFKYVQHNETEHTWQAMGIFTKQPRDIAIIIHRRSRLPKG